MLLLVTTARTGSRDELGTPRKAPFFAGLAKKTAAADQEDFVSMGMNGALKTRQILDNAYGVLAVEAIVRSAAADERLLRAAFDEATSEFVRTVTAAMAVLLTALVLIAGGLLALGSARRLDKD